MDFTKRSNRECDASSSEDIVPLSSLAVVVVLSDVIDDLETIVESAPSCTGPLHRLQLLRRALTGDAHAVAPNAAAQNAAAPNAAAACNA